METVSYTHLDVYKRQLQNLALDRPLEDLRQALHLRLIDSYKKLHAARARAAGLAG